MDNEMLNDIQHIMNSKHRDKWHASQNHKQTHNVSDPLTDLLHLISKTAKRLRKEDQKELIENIKTVLSDFLSRQLSKENI